MDKSKHGGTRQGAGRPRGSGRYHEPTQPRRLPVSLIPHVDQLLASYRANNGLTVGRLEDAPGPLRANDNRADGATPRQLIYGEPAAAMAVRVTEQYAIEPTIKLNLPLYASRVAAGFPSPAADYVEGRIDLNTLLVKHPAATFLVRVQGDSMIGAGIHPHDILIVDRSITPSDGRIVIAVLSGELTVKRLQTRADHVTLLPENPAYEPIVVNDNNEFMIWGVVTNVIHPL